MNRNQIIGGVAILVVVAGGAFYAGTSYGKSQQPLRGGAAGQFFVNGAAGGQPGRAGRSAGGGFTAGSIVSSGNGSISILQQNGSSTEIVLIGPSTQILKSVVGGASDLTIGTDVTVTGTTNSDGSLSATSIQLRPAGGGFTRGPGQ